MLVFQEARGQAGQNRLREHAMRTEVGADRGGGSVHGVKRGGGAVYTSLRRKGSGESGTKGRESKPETPSKAQEAKSRRPE